MPPGVKAPVVEDEEAEEADELEANVVD